MAKPCHCGKVHQKYFDVTCRTMNILLFLGITFAFIGCSLIHKDRFLSKYLGPSAAQVLFSDLFKKVLFSDSIWADNYTKTNFQLKASNDGLIDCGTICSLRKDQCPVFKFDPLDGTCSIAKRLFLL